jgi:integrase
MLTVTVLCGLRLKECVGLRWEDVDWNAGTLYISEDNKTGEPRVIPMAGTVEAILKAQDRRRRELGRDLARVIPSFFTDDAGEPYLTERRRNRISQRTKAAMKAAGIHGASFHSLRHTAGTWAAQAGKTEIEIARLLGHASTATTRRYTHLNADDLRATVNALDSAFRMDTQKDTSTEERVEPGASDAASRSATIG